MQLFLFHEKNKWRENSKLLFVMYFKIGQNEQIVSLNLKIRFSLKN